MSKDLIFGFTKKDWSRKPPEIVHECGPESCMITYRKEPLTADEKAKLESAHQSFQPFIWLGMGLVLLAMWGRSWLRNRG